MHRVLYKKNAEVVCTCSKNYAKREDEGQLEEERGGEQRGADESKLKE